MSNILIGISGSIAAYKSAELVRLLKKQGHDVRVVMTASATEIITPMTMQVLSQNDVRVDLFDHEDEAKIDHISLARWPEWIVIAPATANIMAKIAVGIADDLLSTICLATDVPVAIAPAMNRLMWDNPATQMNLTTLQSRGIKIIAPDAGEQACGEVGTGRMAEPRAIVDWFSQQSQLPEPILSDKHVLITAGPTIERIDPVRFISNDSSGKMGYALAEAAQQLGAKVTLVSGKTALKPPKKVTVIEVESAQQMLDAVLDNTKMADWFIATAAVSDYTVENPAGQKLKKNGGEGLTLTLVQNPDILKTVCSLPKKPFCIGFAAETDNVIDNAKAKRIRKNADLIVANDVSNVEIGFNSDDNAATLIGENYQQVFAKMPKQQLANALIHAAFLYDLQKTQP